MLFWAASVVLIALHYSRGVGRRSRLSKAQIGLAIRCADIALIIWPFSVGAFGVFLIAGLIMTAIDPTSKTVLPDLVITPDGVVVRGDWSCPLIAQLFFLIASQSDILVAWRLRNSSHSTSNSASGSRSADRRVHPGSVALPSTASLAPPIDPYDAELALKDRGSYPPSSAVSLHVRLDEPHRARLPRRQRDDDGPPPLSKDSRRV